MKPDASYKVSIKKEAQNALPFCLPFSKGCVILLKHAGLVYRYYSSFPSWLGGFDSRTLLQKEKPPIRAAFPFGIEWESNGSGVRKRAGGTFSPRPGLRRSGGRLPYPAPRRRSLRTARKRQSRKRLPFPHLCCVSPPFKIGPAFAGLRFCEKESHPPGWLLFLKLGARGSRPAPRRRSLRTARKRQSRKRLPFSRLCCVSPPFKIGPAALGSDFVWSRVWDIYFSIFRRLSLSVIPTSSASSAARNSGNSRREIALARSPKSGGMKVVPT